MPATLGPEAALLDGAGDVRRVAPAVLFAFGTADADHGAAAAFGFLLEGGFVPLDACCGRALLDGRAANKAVGETVACERAAGDLARDALCAEPADVLANGARNRNEVFLAAASL